MKARQPEDGREESGVVPCARQSSAVREFGQLALWMAATLAGMVTAMIVARGPYFRRLGKTVGATPAVTRRRARRGSSLHDCRRPTRAESLPMLAEAIVGNSRGAVAAVFGPPRSAVVCGTTRPDQVPAHQETWYYPLRRGENLAMAIEFDDDDSARHVEFFTAPAVAA